MKRFLPLLTLLLPVAVSATGLTVFTDGSFITFVDVPENLWFKTYVKDAAEANVVSGYKDASGRSTGKFGPADPVTLEQMVKIAVIGAGYRVASAHGHWSEPYFTVANEEQFLFFQESHIAFEAAATRAQVAALIVDAFRVQTNAGLSGRFTDVTARTQHSLAIEALARDGVISGDTDSAGRPTGHFRPGDRINRAEAVKIVMGARASYGTPGSGHGGNSGVGDQKDEAVVTYTDQGFTPSVIRVKAGTLVKFENQSDHDFWIASNPHPVHTDLVGFDAGKVLPSGSIYAFTFTKAGAWEYHDHLHSSRGGTVIVD